MSVFVIEPGSLAGGGEERSLIEMLLFGQVWGRRLDIFIGMVCTHQANKCVVMFMA